MQSSSTERSCESEECSSSVETKLGITSLTGHESSTSKSFSCTTYAQTDKSQKDTHERISHPFNCKYCPKTFSHQRNKVKHERTHTGERPFSCEYCLKTFTRQSHKVRHERTHTGDRPFSCEYCLKTFTRESHKVTHERTHTGERPFSCKYCPKTFNQHITKVTHERTHTGERPFSCKYCPKTFSHQGNKVKHESTHTADRPFSCEYCMKTFTRESHKVIHKRIHRYDTRIVRRSSGSALQQQQQQQQHIHTGDRPFSCEYCAKTFSQQSQKIRHESIHFPSATSSSKYSVGPSAAAESECCQSLCVVSDATSKPECTDSADSQERKLKTCWMCLNEYEEEMDDKSSKQSVDGVDVVEKPSLCSTCYGVLCSKVI